MTDNQLIGFCIHISLAAFFAVNMFYSRPLMKVCSFLICGANLYGIARVFGYVP